MELFKKHKLAVVVVAIVLVLLIVAFYYIGLYARAHLAVVSTSTSVGPMSLSIRGVSQSNFLGYSNFRAIVAYSLFNYTAYNASYLNISFNVYASKPTYNIYLINTSSSCYQCYNLGSVYSALAGDLSSFDLLNGATFKMVKLSSIGSIPNDSIIIIPSGLMPVELMPGSIYTYPNTLLSLLNKGDVVVYVGDNFSRSVGPNNIIFQSSPATEFALGKAGLNYTPYTGSLKGGGGIYAISFSSPTYMLAGGGYRSITYAKILNGTIIAFPNTPLNAWSNASAMSMDIAKIIGTKFWLTTLASGSYNITPQNEGSIGLFTFQKYMYTNETSPSMLNSTYSFIQAVAYNSTGFEVKNIPFRIRWQSNGTLSMQSSVPETVPVPIVMSMTTASASKKTIIPSIYVYNPQMSYIETVPIGFFNTSSNISVIKYVSFELPPGPYIVVLKDITNRYYSSSVFNLENVSISPSILDFKNGTFVFLLSSGGIPINNTPYSISLNGGYDSNGTVYDGTIFYKLPRGTVVNYGTQNFNIKMFSTNFTYSSSYVKEIMHIPTYYIEFAIVIIVVIILNVILKAPNRDEYYIDLPDFVSSNKVNVTVKEDEIISLFDKANYYRKWHYMPLTLEEVKSNVSNNLRYGNMPISVTTQNMRMVLSQLVEEGSLLEKGNYFMPKRWVSDSGHDDEYLTIFRILRDYCVTHGMLFTDLNSSELADMVVTRSGSERYLIIYTSTGKMRPIKLNNTSKIYIVFIDEDTMRSFKENLYASTGVQAEIIKMGISSGNIKLVDVQHLDEIM